MVIVFSNKIKWYAQCVVAVISVIIVIIGILTLAMGAAVSGLIDLAQWGTPDMESQAKLGLGVLILGLLAIVIGVLGCLTCKCKKIYFSIPFIISTALIGLIILVIGVIMSGHEDVIQGAKASLCGPDSKLDQQYNKAVSKFVCSKQCPCPEGGTNQTNSKLWLSQDETLFNKWGRTNTNGVPSKSEYKSLFFVKEGEESFSNWIDCYDKKIKDLYGENVERSAQEEFLDHVQDGNIAALTQMTKEGGLELVELAESKLGCGGMCSPALFYTTTDISEGPPTKECITAALEELKNAPKVAAAFSIICGLVMLLASCSSFPLCFGFADDQVPEEQGAKDVTEDDIKATEEKRKKNQEDVAKADQERADKYKVEGDGEAPKANDDQNKME